MSGPSRSAASEPLATVLEEEEEQIEAEAQEEQQEEEAQQQLEVEAQEEEQQKQPQEEEAVQQQQQEEPEPRYVDVVTIEVVTRAVSTRSPGGTRKATATTTTTITVEGSEEEQQQPEGLPVDRAAALAAAMAAAEAEAEAAIRQASPPQKAVNWVIADGRRGVLETEPAKSNLARTHTLQGVAERVRERVVTEGQQLLKIQEEVASATGASALDPARLWYLEHSFQRRVRHHLQLVFAEMHQLHEAHQFFDPQTIAENAGGPALRLLDDLSASTASSASESATDTNTNTNTSRATATATSTSHPEPATASSSGQGARARRRRSVGVPEGDQHVSEAEEACGSSGESMKAVEELEAAMANVPRGGSGGQEEARFSPVQWSRDHYDKVRAKSSSGSSTNGGSSSSGSGLVESARTLQEADGSSEAATMDRLIHAAVEESEACEAMQVFRELQRHFDNLADTLRQHALVADGVLKQGYMRKMRGGGPGAAQEEQRPPLQQQLLHEVGLVHFQMQRTQRSLVRSESELRRIVDTLPPPPTMVQLPPPPTPPARPRRSGLSWFSSLLKKRFTRR